RVAGGGTGDRAMASRHPGSGVPWFAGPAQYGVTPIAPVLQRYRLIESRSSRAAVAAASAKSSPPEAYRIARGELVTSPAPSALFAFDTTASMSPPCAPT